MWHHVGKDGVSLVLRYSLEKHGCEHETSLQEPRGFKKVRMISHHDIFSGPGAIFDLAKPNSSNIYLKLCFYGIVHILRDSYSDQFSGNSSVNNKLA